LLPKYLLALPIAGILLLGVLFLAEIQILHMSFAYLYGKQRQFLFLTVGALLFAFSITLVMAIWLGSLVAIAVGQVGALVLWWFVNEWSLRKTTGQRWIDRLQLVSVFAWSVMSYWIVMKSLDNVGLRIVAYYALVGGCLVFTCYPEMRILWKLLSRALPQTATQ
jgi:hypothetical protein